MNNDQLINEAIAILQTMNMEDCALAIHNLREEHNRVRIIAHGRLVKIGNLQHDVAVLEDKLEDTRSELTLTRGHAAAHRTAAAKMAEELEDTRSDLKSTFGGAPSRALEELGREPRSHLENELADQRASAFRTADALQYIVNYCR